MDSVDSNQQSMAKALKHIIECPVCYDVLTDPQSLPCDHFLCRGCIGQVRDGDQVKCPVCSGFCNVAEARPDLRLVQVIEALREKENGGSTVSASTGKVFIFFNIRITKIHDILCIGLN